jgi:hypothetical protein
MPASVEYQIAVTDGKTSLTLEAVATYLDDLIRAMDELAPQVVTETFNGSSNSTRRRALRQRQRRLSIKVEEPSEATILGNFSTCSTRLCVRDC